MSLDFERTCSDPSHGNEKVPLVGIKAEGDGIRYVFACGHGQIIQVVGDPNIVQIANRLRENTDKSLDELYEELSEFELVHSQVKIAKKHDKKRGESIFKGTMPYLREIICDKFKLCEKIEYFQVGLPPTTALLIAEGLVSANPNWNYGAIILIASILMHIPLIKLKKLCSC
ncbi:MAG: hypothetical protein YK1309IOTA_1880001 [Marine Group I thaumarchaeote]|nr:MAG: hypothetical protein YK1309IOTA_1880001 [Marine Group I thaumarchaeote]